MADEKNWELVDTMSRTSLGHWRGTTAHVALDHWAKAHGYMGWQDVCNLLNCHSGFHVVGTKVLV